MAKVLEGGKIILKYKYMEREILNADICPLFDLSQKFKVKIEIFRVFNGFFRNII